MPLSNSVLRRYTPPTCTLEVAAKNSPLSRLVGQSVIKDLRFELRFDDPRKPEDQRVTIRGDRTDLEVLYEAVSSYVQQFLEQSPLQLSLALHKSDTTSGSTPDEVHYEDSHTHSDSFVNDSAPETAQFFEPQPNESDDSSPVRNPESETKLQTFEPWTHSTGIYLQPKGLVTHNLFLGQLATEESGPVVNLSVLQLFDLATALDEYAAEIVALPKLNSPHSLNKAPSPMARNIALPPWTRAAAVVLLAVGATAAAAKFLYKPDTKQQAAVPKQSSQLSPTQLPPLTQVPPVPTTPLATPLPTPAILPSLAASPKLLPPSAVNIPPLPTIGSPSTLNAPPLGQRPSISITPAPFSSTKTTIPAKRSNPALVPGGIAFAPTPAASSPRNSRSSTDKTATGQKTAIATATPLPLPQLPTLKSIPAVPPEVSSNAAPSSVPPSPTSRNSTPSPEQNPSESLRAAKPDNNTLFDNIPQIAEARSYLQKRWKPPSGLTQTLEYSLQLNTDGTIQRIIPRNNAAVEYLDRSTIPMPGDPFVSPVPGEGNPMLRVVLGQDGKVQTFLEK